MSATASDTTPLNVLERSNALVDAARYAPAMLWVSDHNGAMVFLNEAYLHFTGLTESQAKQSDSWVKQLHPEDSKRAMQAYVDALTTRQSFSVEYRLRRHDGEYRHVLDMGQPRISDGGTFCGYVGATLDVTERRQEQDALRTSQAYMEERSRQMSLIYEMKSDFQVCRHIEEMVPVLKLYGQQLFAGRWCELFLYNNSRDIVEPFAGWGGDACSMPFAPNDCWSLRKGKAHAEVAGPHGAICPNAHACKGHSYLCLPLVAFGETIGILRIGAQADELRTHASPSAAGHVSAIGEIAAMVADEAATTVEELKLRQKLEQQSIRDSLTKLYNRRYFVDCMNREVDRVVEHDGVTSVLLLDMDHFKALNDSHGHGAGDAVLRAFATVLESAVRGKDVACRYGGEEFAVLMPDCPTEGAMSRAETIRADVAALEIDYHGTTLSDFTTSIGVATLPHDARSSQELMARADAALYAAKGAGRNRCVSCSDIPA